MNGMAQLSLAALLEEFLEERIPPYLSVRGLERDVELALTRFAIRRAKGNKKEAARILGRGRITVAHRLDRYGLDAWRRDASAQPRRSSSKSTQQNALA